MGQALRKRSCSVVRVVVPVSLFATKDKPCCPSRMLHRPVPAALARRFAQSPKDSRSTGILVALTYMLADGPVEVMK